MAHFAQLNNLNTVIQVVTVNNDVINNAKGLDGEAIGIAFCQSLCGADTRWAQTSYNNNYRYNYAAIGDTFDGIGFIKIQPYPSWTLDKTTYQWMPPVPYPTDAKIYHWDETTQTWIAG
jgi:hypothetical protein